MNEKESERDRIRCNIHFFRPYHLLLALVPVHEGGAGGGLGVPAQPARVLQRPLAPVLLRVQHRRVVRAEPHQQRVPLGRRLRLHLQNVLLLLLLVAVVPLLLRSVVVLILIVPFPWIVLVTAAAPGTSIVVVPILVRHGGGCFETQEIRRKNFVHFDSASSGGSELQCLGVPPRAGRA
jgi:hypothetical protein